MHRFRFAALAAVALVGFASVASAADMPMKAAPMVAPVAAYNWTGFYVNGGIGYGMWAADTGTFDAVTGACSSCLNQVQGGKGWLGVVGGGFDYQFTSNIVAGVFADFNISSLKGTIQDEDPLFAGDIKQTSSWAAGARAGWLVTPRVMSYVNGGYTSARFSSASMVDTRTGAPTTFSTPTFTANGGFLGGGVEAVIAPGWFWRNEYRYAYYGTKLLPDTNGTGVVDASISFKPTVQTVTSQVVYKFDPGHMAPAYMAPPMVSANWTGFYLNGGAGYGIWAADTTTLTQATGLCRLCSPQRQGGKGYLGMVGAGYDWQFAPMWVAGVFGDFDVSSLKGSIQDQQTGSVGEIKQTSAWAVGARAGWLVTPAMLAYVNGGFSSARFSGVQMASEFSPFAPQGTSQGFTRNGWFVGGGAETAFALLGKGWFWRNEYRYASYDTQTIAITGAGFNVTFKPVVQTVTSSVVFKFN